MPAMLQACLMGVPDLATRRPIYYGNSPIAEPTLRAAGPGH